MLVVKVVVLFLSEVLIYFLYAFLEMLDMLVLLFSYVVVVDLRVK
jgi:hypothetical protein